MSGPDPTLRHAEDVEYRPYRSEEYDLPDIMDLVDQELSEPYNIYTFRYFLQEWPHLAWLVFPSRAAVGEGGGRQKAIATIVCKQDYHKGRVNRGYIAMLSVDKAWRRKGIARKLIDLAMRKMIDEGADEIVLETEYDNRPSLSLYGSMGFIKDRRLYRFYLNGKDAFRLVYPILKQADEYELPLGTSQPQSSLSLSANGVDISAERDNGISHAYALRDTENGEESAVLGSLETLVEEGEIAGNPDQQVDSTRRLVERRLVL